MMQMNIFMNRNRFTDIEDKLAVPKGERVGGINWEFGINGYTLLNIRQINNNRYSKGNYIQYLVITYNGKKLEKEHYIYVCVYVYTHSLSLDIINIYTYM